MADLHPVNLSTEGWASRPQQHCFSYKAPYLMLLRVQEIMKTQKFLLWFTHFGNRPQLENMPPKVESLALKHEENLIKDLYRD